MYERRSLFPDQELAPPIKPEVPQKLTKKGRLWRIMGSLGLATVVHSTIKDHLNEQNRRNIDDMQQIAQSSGEPLVIHETTTRIKENIANVLQGEPVNTDIQTTIINPPGQNPPIKIITSEETILVDSEGNAEQIIPHDENTQPSLTEAQTTVDNALKDAAEKTLPQGELPNPFISPKEEQ